MLAVLLEYTAIPSQAAGIFWHENVFNEILQSVPMWGNSAF